MCEKNMAVDNALALVGLFANRTLIVQNGRPSQVRVP